MTYTYESVDSEKYNLKDIYRKINEFSLLFHSYYKHWSKTDRGEKMNYISRLISDSIVEIQRAYVSRDVSKLRDLYRSIEFLIRDAYKCKIIDSKQHTSLSKLIGQILIFINNYELRK